MNIQKIIFDFLAVDNLDTEAVDRVSKAFMDYMNQASDPEKELLRAVMSAKVKMMTTQAKELIEESQNAILMDDTIINLNEWVTIKEYAKRFHIASTNVISNWIKRGIIPPENIKTLPMLNGIKVIKAVQYL